MAALLSASAIPALRAQQPQIRQTETLPPPAQTPVVTREEPETEESEDLGRVVILKRVPRPKYFSAYSDTQYLYDSNVFLTKDHEKGDGLLYQTFNLSFSPRLIEKLTSTISFRYQMVRYNARDELDFDALVGAANLYYRLTDWLTVYSGFQAEQLHSDEHDDDFYKEYDTQFGLWFNKPLGQRLWFYYGYQFDWRPTTPSRQTRLENAGYLGLNLMLMDKLGAQALYRVRYTDYLQTDQNDVDQFVNVALTYTFNEWVNLRAYANYEYNDSNLAAFDFEVINVGGGLNLSIRF